MTTLAQIFIFVYDAEYEVEIIGIAVIDRKDYSKLTRFSGDIGDLPAFEAAVSRSGFTRQPDDPHCHIWSRYTDDTKLAAGEGS